MCVSNNVVRFYCYYYCLIQLIVKSDVDNDGGTYTFTDIASHGQYKKKSVKAIYTGRCCVSMYIGPAYI